MADNTEKKTYLGDGVYAEYDGYHIVLTTENGISVTNEIAIELEVLEALIHFAEKIYRKNWDQPEGA